MEYIVEFVLSRAKEGVTDEQILAASDALQRDVVAFDGYVSRQLFKNEEGQWVDLVHWTSLEAAQRAAEVIMARPSAHALMTLIDESSVTMLHVKSLRNYDRKPAPAAVSAAVSR